MKKGMGILLIVVILLFGSLIVFADPTPSPGTNSAPTSSTTIPPIIGNPL